MSRIPDVPTLHLALLATSALLGCGAGLTDPGTTPDPDPSVTEETYAAVGDTVRLDVGASVTFQPMGVQVTFLRLVDDSRCPVGVTCVWEGDAEVEIRVSIDGDTRLTRLHTTLEPRAVTLGANALQLVDVLPYPIDDPLADPALPTIVVTLGAAAPGS